MDDGREEPPLPVDTGRCSSHVGDVVSHVMTIVKFKKKMQGKVKSILKPLPGPLSLAACYSSSEGDRKSIVSSTVSSQEESAISTAVLTWRQLVTILSICFGNFV